MAFADDLLEQAQHLATRESGEPKQASIRRAVSTAYYALFHLLIEDAVSHWGVPRQRSILARTFDHGKMRAVCNERIKAFYSSPQHGSVQEKNVAQIFVDLQDERHEADYNNGVVWSREDALVLIDRVGAAFADWRAIRTLENGEDFLLKLFFPKPPRT